MKTTTSSKKPFELLSLKCPKPQFVNSNLNSENRPANTLRKFGQQYDNLDEEIEDYLYPWLNVSYDVLWQISKTSNTIEIFENTNQALSERYALILNLSSKEAKEGVYEMTKALALANFYIEKVIFMLGGNWVLKLKNKYYQGSVKLFMFWLAYKEIEGNEIAKKCFNVFKNKFAKEVSFDWFGNHSDDEISNTFMRCFYKFNNDIDVFKIMLDGGDSIWYYDIYAYKEREQIVIL